MVGMHASDQFNICVPASEAELWYDNKSLEDR